MAEDAVYGIHITGPGKLNELQKAYLEKCVELAATQVQFQLKDFVVHIEPVKVIPPLNIDDTPPS